MYLCEINPNDTIMGAFKLIFIQLFNVCLIAAFAWYTNMDPKYDWIIWTWGLGVYFGTTSYYFSDKNKEYRYRQYDKWDD